MEILLVLIVVIMVIQSVIAKKKQQNTPRDQALQEVNAGIVDEALEQDLAEIYAELERVEYIKNAYQPKWMFSQNEKYAYYKLREIAEKHNLIVFSKVRLFDLVTPMRNHPKYKTNLYKIQAKHVDFVLTKGNLVAKYIIELDDSSHNNPQRHQRDIFVDNVLSACGYKVLHVRNINEEEITTFINKN